MRTRAGLNPASPAVILVAATLVASDTVFAQPEFASVAIDEAQRQIVEQIQDIGSRDGVTSASLIPPFTELALLFEEGGKHGLAIAAIEHTLHLVRANHGLHSLDQAQLLRQAIRNEEASGDLAAAWDREQRLLELATRHPEDLRTVPILREVADRRMNVFDQWTAGEYPPQMILGGYCQPLGQIFVCSRHEVTRQVLADAQAYYADAIAVMLRNELYSSEELRALEMELVRTNDLPRARPELADETRLRRASVRKLPGHGLPKRPLGVEESERDPVASRLGLDPINPELDQLGPRDAAGGQMESGALLTGHINASTYYEHGRRSLRRLYNYEVASSAPPPDRLNAFVQIADWDLLYSRNTQALEEYEQVYAWLTETHASQASIEELFAPRIPVVLPAFAPNPLATEQGDDSTDYIDVEFRITRYGTPQRIRIMATTTHATDAAQKCLVQLIRSSRFRPRVRDGEFRASPVILRYHLNDVCSIGAQDVAAANAPRVIDPTRQALPNMQ
jgi:hypothetical protein